VIQLLVSKLLQETRAPITDSDFKTHVEHIVLIRLGNLLKAGTLTFHKYNHIKQEHLEYVKEAIRNKEIDQYDFTTDVFVRLDRQIGIKETYADIDPMIIVGPEDESEIAKSKVKDHFPERKKKEKEEEKIVIKPADVTLRPKEEVPAPVIVEGEEEIPDDTIAKSKVKDHFPERKKKEKKEEKIVIKPAGVTLRSKEEIIVPDLVEEVEETPDEARSKSKVKDHFPERTKKEKGEEKIIIKPADLNSRKRVPMQEEEIAETAILMDESSPAVLGDDTSVQNVVRRLLNEVKINLSIKTLMHHVDHVYMIRLGTALKSGVLTFEKYIRIKTNDRRRIKELVNLSDVKDYNESEDVFSSLDNSLKTTIGGRSKEDDNTLVKEQVSKLLKDTRVPVSPKDFIFHMNKIITIVLGMMLHKNALTFSKFQRLKCSHREDMDEILNTNESQPYIPENDIFSALEREIKNKSGDTSSKPQERGSDRGMRKAPLQRGTKKEPSDQDISQRKEDILAGFDPNEHPEDSSMRKLGMMLEKGSLEPEKYHQRKKPTDIKFQPVLPVLGVLGGEEETPDDTSSKAKVKDHFPERKKKEKEEEKIVIKPADVPLQSNEEIIVPDLVEEVEETPDETILKSKVKDHFPERKKKEKEEEKIVIKPADIPLQSNEEIIVPDLVEEVEETPDETILKSKVKDHFPERKKKEKEEEKIVIKPADVTLRSNEEVPAPVTVEGEEETPDDTIAKSKVKDHFPERTKKEKEEEKIIITPSENKESDSGTRPDDKKESSVKAPPRVRLSDIKVQNDQLDRLIEEGAVNNEMLRDYISVFLHENKVPTNSKDLKHHMEHIVMIKLGRMLRENTLTFTKYTKVKIDYRRQMDDMMIDQIIDNHDSRADIFARMDSSMKRARMLEKLDENTLVEREVANLLSQTKVPVSQKDYIYHMEHIVLIKLGRLAQKCTLTFTKYKRIKENQREKGSDEIETYNPNDDIFSMIDDMLIRREKILTGTLSRHDLEVMTDRSRPEDSSMKRLGKMLGEEDNESETAKVKDEVREPKPAIKIDKHVKIDETPQFAEIPEPKDKEKKKEEEAIDDTELQEYVSALLDKENVKMSTEGLRHHMEHVVMIRLGRMSQAHSLSTEKSLATKYMKIKGEYRRLMNKLVEENILQEHETNTDIFARLDNEMKETKHTSYITDEDTLIQKAVTNLMQQTKVPVSQNDLIFHMEHVVLIRFSHMVQTATLTFEKYTDMKKDHRDSVKEDVPTFSFSSDVFAKIDRMIVRKEKFVPDSITKPDSPKSPDASRGDWSMDKLGKMLDNRAGIKSSERPSVRISVEAHEHDFDIFGKPDMEQNTKSSGKREEKDVLLQKHVRLIISNQVPPVTEDNLQKHIEHVILIKLGRMVHAGTLTFDAYTETKNRHHKQIKERLQNDEIESYDFENDVYGRIDRKINEEEAHASRFGRLTKRDKDRIIRNTVDSLLIKERVIVTEDNLQHHIEHILLIKLGRMLKRGTLVFEKYTRMKNRHREDIRIRLRRKEILRYNYEVDVYGRLDAAMENDIRTAHKANKPEKKLTVIEEEEPIVVESVSSVETTPEISFAETPVIITPEAIPEDEVSFVVHLSGAGTTNTTTPTEVGTKDAIIQKHVQFLIDESTPQVNPRKLQHHIEHVIMIKLGNLLNDGSLNFQQYSSEKDKVREQLVDDFAGYDIEADIYARLDNDLMTEESRAARAPRRKGDVPEDRDSIIKKLVAALLKEAKIPTGSKDLRYHEEHIVLIKLCNKLQRGTLNMESYKTMKETHRDRIRQKLLTNEIEYYSFDTDVFGRIDKLISVELGVEFEKEHSEEANRNRAEILKAAEENERKAKEEEGERKRRLEKEKNERRIKEEEKEKKRKEKEEEEKRKRQIEEEEKEKRRKEEEEKERKAKEEWEEQKRKLKEEENEKKRKEEEEEKKRKEKEEEEEQKRKLEEEENERKRKKEEEERKRKEKEEEEERKRKIEAEENERKRKNEEDERKRKEKEDEEERKRKAKAEADEKEKKKNEQEQKRKEEAERLSFEKQGESMTDKKKWELLVAGEQNRAEEEASQNVIQIVSLQKHEGEEDEDAAWTLKVRGSGLKDEKDWVSMLPVTYGRDTDSPIPPKEAEDQFQHDDHFEKIMKEKSLKSYVEIERDSYNVTTASGSHQTSIVTNTTSELHETSERLKNLLWKQTNE